MKKTKNTMEKTFGIVSSLALGGLLTFALITSSCKKNSPSTTTTPTNNSNNTNNNNTPTVTSLTIDGVAQSNISASGGQSISGSYYDISESQTTSYVSTSITFLGGTAPVSGTYTILPNPTGTVNPTAGHCTMTYYNFSNLSYATSGVVKITAAASPSNTAVFSGIVCTGAAGTHTLTGTYKY